MTESKHTITTELSIVADQQLRNAEGIARAICDRINLKVFSGTYTKANTSLKASLHLFLTWQPHFSSSSVLGRIEDELQFSSKENEIPAKPARSSHPSCVLHVNAKYLEASQQSEQPTMDPSQYARLPSTPGENSLFQYGGKEGSTSQSRAPSQTPRVGLISSSPPGERFHFLNFTESVFDKASQPRYGHRFGFDTSIDQNDGSAKSSSKDVKQGSRLLIDAYGGNDTSHEKLPKVQRLNAYQGMTNLQCNEEDMYAWKNMSHILAIQGKELKLGPPRPNVGSNRENAALPEKEFKTSRPSQPFLPRPDICANDLLKMQLLTYVWGPQFEQRKYTNRQRLYLYEQVFYGTYTKANTSLQASVRHLFLTWQPHFSSSVLGRIEDELQFSSKENENPAKPARSSHPSCVLHVNAKYLEASHQSEQPTMVFSGTYTKANTSLKASLRHLFLTWQPHFSSSSVLGRIEYELQFSSKENENPAKPARSSHPSCGLHVNAKYLEASHQSEQPTMTSGCPDLHTGVLESLMVLT